MSAAERARIEVVAAGDAWAERAAGVVAKRIGAALAARGSALVALAGGGTPRPVYRRLARRDDVDWSRVCLVLGDERLVESDDPRSNRALVERELLTGAARAARFEPPGNGPDAAAEYEQRLRRLVTATAGTLDLVLLGVGTDGHTASLFPDGAELDATSWVTRSRAPAPPVERLTLTLPLLSGAREIVFLVAGAGKASTLAALFGDAGGSSTLPAARLAARRDSLWLVDEPAAAGLGLKARR